MLSGHIWQVLRINFLSFFLLFFFWVLCLSFSTHTNTSLACKFLQDALLHQLLHCCVLCEYCRQRTTYIWISFVEVCRFILLCIFLCFVKKMFSFSFYRFISAFALAKSFQRCTYALGNVRHGGGERVNTRERERQRFWKVRASIQLCIYHSGRCSCTNSKSIGISQQNRVLLKLGHFYPYGRWHVSVLKQCATTLTAHFQAKEIAGKWILLPMP